MQGHSKKRLAATLALLGSLYALSQWLIIAILARQCGPQGLGNYSLALAWVSPISVASLMGLRQLLVTDERGARNFPAYLWLRVTGSLASVAIVGTAALVFGIREDVASLMLPMSIIKAAESLADLAAARCNLSGNFGGPALRRGLSGLSQAAFTWVALDRGTSLAHVQWLVVVPTLVYVAAEVWCSKHYVAELKFSSVGTLSIARQGAALAVVALADSGTMAVPRLVLDAVDGPAAVGAYSAVMSVLPVFGIMLAALNDINRREVALMWHSRNDGWRAITWRTALGAGAAGLACSVLALVAGSRILAIVFGEEFAGSATYAAVALLVCGVWGASGVLCTSCLAVGRGRALLPNALLGLIFCVLASILTVQQLHVIGAIFAVGVAYGLRGLHILMVMR